MVQMKFTPYGSIVGVWTSTVTDWPGEGDDGVAIMVMGCMIRVIGCGTAFLMEKGVVAGRGISSLVVET